MLVKLLTSTVRISHMAGMINHDRSGYNTQVCSMHHCETVTYGLGIEQQSTHFCMHWCAQILQHPLTDTCNGSKFAQVLKMFSAIIQGATIAQQQQLLSPWKMSPRSFLQEVCWSGCPARLCLQQLDCPAFPAASKHPWTPRICWPRPLLHACKYAM